MNLYGQDVFGLQQILLILTAEIACLISLVNKTTAHSSTFGTVTSFSCWAVNYFNWETLDLLVVNFTNIWPDYATDL